MSELERASAPDDTPPAPSKAKKPNCEPCDVGAPLYMATFSDMAILLMAFFVLLLSMTEIDLRTWQKITGQIRLAFGTQSINLDFPIPKAQSMMIDNFSPNEAARNISSEVRQKIETEGQLRVRNTETFDNRFDIEREFLILEAALESEISKGEVNVKIIDERWLKYQIRRHRLGMDPVSLEKDLGCKSTTDQRQRKSRANPVRDHTRH